MQDEKQQGFDVPSVQRTYKLTDLKAAYIVDGFRSVIDPARIPEWEDASNKIEVTDENQTGEMAAARELRLSIRQHRIAVENKRKELKEDALRESKAIDGLGGAVRDRIKAIESHLQEQEDYAKRVAEERERLRREEADRLLREKEAKEARAREEARIAEEKRMREENERLRAEQEAHNRELAAERKARGKAERKAAEARRKERERIRKQEEKKREAERKRHEEELAAARAESERLAALVKCPKCGHEFDSREHGAEDDEG